MFSISGLLFLLIPLFTWPFHHPNHHPLLLFALRSNAPVFSANLRQTLLIQLVQQPPPRTSIEEGREKGIAQLGKRATEPTNGGGIGRRSLTISRKSQQHHHHNHEEHCERLSERQKYARLESIGGRNQQFMANTPREAGHNFGSLLPQQIAEEEPPEIFLLHQNDDPQMINSDDQQQEEMSGIGTVKCDQRCREIKRKLEHALGDAADWDWTERLDDGVMPSADRADDGGGQLGPDEAGIGIGGRRGGGGGGGCKLEHFVPIGNCTEHGFEEAQGSEKLCTACQGIFLLNRNCFPLFVNSVVCGRHELECIYDRMSGSAQGKCRPKMLSFKVMFNRGTSECQRWTFEHLEVPVACECYLSKRSVWLEAVPPPSLVVSDEH